MANIVGDTQLVQPDILGSVNQGFALGRQQRNSGILAQYAQGAANGDQGALAQIYQADPGAGMKMQQFSQQQQQSQQGQQDALMQSVGKKARIISALAKSGDLQGANSLYQQSLPEAQQIFQHQLPTTLDLSTLPNLDKIADALDPPQAKEGFTLGAGQTRFGADGKVIAKGPESSPRYMPIQTDSGYAAFDPRTASAVPVNYAGSQSGQVPAPAQIAPTQGGFQTSITPASPDNVDAASQANAMLAQGMPQEQVMQRLIQAHPDQKFQLAVDPVSGQFKDVSDGSAQFAPSQAGPKAPPFGFSPAPMGRVMPAPKQSAPQDAFRAATPDELKRYGLPENSVAQVNTKTGKLDVISKPAALSPDKLADVAVKRQKVEQAKQESVATFNDSINKIDSLLNDKSFSALGTFTGDIAAKIPHTDTANARAALDTISAQSVINVLSSLKSLSANGASGFGALSEKEGEILRNAAANLSTSQDNASLKKNLLDLKKKLARSRDLVAAQQIKLPEDQVGNQTAQPSASGDFSHLWGG